MRQAGLIDARPDHLDLIDALDRGATKTQLVAATTKAIGKGKGFAYAVGVLKGHLDDAANPTKRNGAADPDAIHDHNSRVAEEWLRDQQGVSP